MKDTPPTRSRSRKGRVAFDEPIIQKSALKNANGASKSDKSRSRSKSVGRSASAVRRQPLFEPPKFGRSGNTRLDAFEAKFDKYRANKRSKEVIEKRAEAMKLPAFDITTKNKESPSKRTKRYTTVVGAEINFKPSGKFDKDFLMPEGYENHLMR